MNNEQRVLRGFCRMQNAITPAVCPLFWPRGRGFQPPGMLVPLSSPVAIQAFKIQTIDRLLPAFHPPPWVSSSSPKIISTASPETALPQAWDGWDRNTIPQQHQKEKTARYEGMSQVFNLMVHTTVSDVAPSFVAISCAILRWIGLQFNR